MVDRTTIVIVSVLLHQSYESTTDLNKAFSIAYVIVGDGSKYSDKGWNGICWLDELDKTCIFHLNAEGAPSALRRDNTKEEKNFEAMDIRRKFLVKDQRSDTYNQHQNPVEGCAIEWLKSASNVLLDRTGAPDATWYFAVKYLGDVHNVTYDSGLDMKPKQRRYGIFPDISADLQHALWDPILYLDHKETWPSTKERPGR